MRLIKLTITDYKGTVYGSLLLPIKAVSNYLESIYSTPCSNQKVYQMVRDNKPPIKLECYPTVYTTYVEPDKWEAMKEKAGEEGFFIVTIEAGFERPEFFAEFNPVQINAKDKQRKELALSILYDRNRKPIPEAQKELLEGMKKELEEAGLFDPAQYEIFLTEGKG